MRWRSAVLNMVEHWYGEVLHSIQSREGVLDRQVRARLDEIRVEEVIVWQEDQIIAARLLHAKVHVIAGADVRRVAMVADTRIAERSDYLSGRIVRRIVRDEDLEPRIHLRTGAGERAPQEGAGPVVGWNGKRHQRRWVDSRPAHMLGITVPRPASASLRSLFVSGASSTRSNHPSRQNE